MKIQIASVYLVLGAEGDKRVKVEYEAVDPIMRVVGMFLKPVDPASQWDDPKVLEQMVEEHLRENVQAITAIKAVVQRYKGQEIDVPVEDMFG